MHPGMLPKLHRPIASCAAAALAIGLFAAGAHAQTPPTDRAEPAKPAEKAGKSDKADKASRENLEARLEAARDRLEKAASEVGELSAQLGESFANRVEVMGMEPRRAIIGVQLDSANGKDGARVREVSPGGPAAEAGVRAGDVIVAVNGKEVKGEAAREVVRLMRDVEPDGKVKLRVMRDGKPKEFELTARPMVRSFSFRTMPNFEMPDVPEPPEPPEPFEPFNFMPGWRGGMQGMELTTLTPGLGRYFGTEKGVLVVRAPDASTYKLQEGDVILSIDGREPTNGSHATRILRSYRAGEKLTMRIMRDRKAVNMEVTLPDPPRRERRVNFRPEQEA
jgi:C-terminal processing protease CtpA/Prc